MMDSATTGTHLLIVFLAAFNPNWSDEYCKSLKYSGNNKIAIIALCPYALL